MLRGMTALQLEEWKEFERLEPWGPERMDKLFAHLRQILMEVHRDVKSQPKAITLEDAMIYFGEDAWERREKAKVQPALDTGGRMDWRFMKMFGQAMAESSQGV